MIQPDALKLAHTWKHDRQFLACRLVPGTDAAWAGGHDGRLYRFAAGEEQPQSWEAHRGWLETILLSRDGARLYTADSWGEVRCWELKPEGPRAAWRVERACGSWLRQAALSPDGQWLAICGNEPVVRVYSAADGKLQHELRGHEHPVLSVAFTPAGDGLASGDLRGVVRHWELPAGREARRLDAGRLYKPFHQFHQGGVRAMAFDAQGETLYCAGIQGTNANQAQGQPMLVALDWGAGKERLVQAPAESFNGPLTDVVVHPQGFVAALGSSEAGGVVWLWRAGEAKSFFSLKHATSFRRCDLSADGGRLLAAAFGDMNGQRGGNGRRLNEKGEYVGFGGNLVLYSWPTT